MPVEIKARSEGLQVCIWRIACGFERGSMADLKALNSPDNQQWRRTDSEIHRRVNESTWLETRWLLLVIA
jgi:hypothetical protein